MSPVTTVEGHSTTATCWLSIVGVGEDGPDGLTPRARRLVANAELVVGGARHLALADCLIEGERLVWPTPLHDAFPEILRRRGRPVTILASGDPFHFGVGKQLAGLVGASELLCIPQPSAFSLAAARLRWSLQDVATVTLHGRAIENIVRHLQPRARIIALSWDGSTPLKVANLLSAYGLGLSRITVLEAMGGPRERVTSAVANSFSLGDIQSLNTIAIEVVVDEAARAVPASPPEDDAFESDGQLTKRDVRAVTLSALAPRRCDLLWDIGLGAGSIAIAWLLSDTSLRAIGIEERPDRAARAQRNARKLGTPDLDVVVGRAPLALSGLAAPDAIFIGGGLNDQGMVEGAWSSLKAGGRLVANAVTLESEATLFNCFRCHGGELLRMELSRAGELGGLHGWQHARPVTQWRVRKS